MFWDNSYAAERQRHGENLTFEFLGEGFSKYFSNTAKSFPRVASLQFLFCLNVLTVTLFSSFFRVSERNHCVQKFLTLYTSVQRRAKIYDNFRRATICYFSLSNDKRLVELCYKMIHGIKSSKSSQEGTFSRLHPCTEYISRCLEVKDGSQLWY